MTQTNCSQPESPTQPRQRSHNPAPTDHSSQKSFLCRMLVASKNPAVISRQETTAGRKLAFEILNVKIRQQKFFDCLASTFRKVEPHRHLRFFQQLRGRANGARATAAKDSCGEYRTARKDRSPTTAGMPERISGWLKRSTWFHILHRLSDNVNVQKTERLFCHVDFQCSSRQPSTSGGETFPSPSVRSI